uniref:Dehydrogenase/reductase SDR family member 1 n=1 Tax=Caenorhabditis japonica TaxID=281687 RepID=A0A8R1DXY4_CAEJA
MSLSGKVAIVTGASRGCGRGIALQLAEAGCTLFITARKPEESLSSQLKYLPTLEDTAEECKKRGAKCYHFYVNHSDMAEVEQFFEKVAQITDNQLDILVNNAFSAVTKCGSSDKRKFFEKEPEIWDDINNVGLRNQYYCSVFGTRLMSKNGMKGLIVNISSLGGIMYLFNVAYGVGKMAIDRMSSDIAHELRDTDITVISLWPSAVRTELIINMLESSTGSWGKTENQMFLNGESIEYCGKAVVAIAADTDRKVWNGSTLISTDMGNYYSYADIDGRVPTNLRSLRGLLQISRHETMASWFPSWLNLPGWALTLWQNKISH